MPNTELHTGDAVMINHRQALLLWTQGPEGNRHLSRSLPEDAITVLEKCSETKEPGLGALGIPEKQG